MGKLLNDCYTSLVRAISDCEGVLSIGKSGASALPEHGESDIDIFIFCSQLPEIKTRQAAMETLNGAVTTVHYGEHSGRFWGTMDFLAVDDTEICLMYFTARDAEEEIESILRGARLDREEEYFYPIGRCATMLFLWELYDESGFIAKMKERLSVYPNELSAQLFSHPMNQAYDAEDFERAVYRSDVLFYHGIVEKAIDHFLRECPNRCP